jgi:hypothetical protein
MSRQFRSTVTAPAALLAAMIAAALLPGCASEVTAEGDYSVPRTPWGDPDFSGVWPSTHMVGTPFERPPQFGERRYLTEEEFQERERQAQRQQEIDLAPFSIDDADNVPGGAVGGPVSPPPHWLERGEPQYQASLLIDPPNGHLPPMTDEGRERQAGLSNTYLRDDYFASFTEFGPYDRCISRGVVGSMMPVVYNNGNKFVQAPGLVAFVNEMIHETRIIPLDGRPPVASEIRMWMGDSRGHWDGDTLVVHTTNLNGRTGAQGNGMSLMFSDRAEITERFTRTGENTMQYEVTVNDPGTWTAPWTATFPLRRDADYDLFEYACHEGNYALRHSLSASRMLDAQR